MQTVWLVMLGLMLTGWSVLDGANLGLGMSLRRPGRSERERRLLLTALGPFLLAGEVWLVAGAGLLIGVFPAFEKDLLAACYPIVVALVVSWVLRDAGVWLRSRRPGRRWRRGWERTVAVASGGFAFAWGVLLASVAQGVPLDGGVGLGTLIGPYSLLWGAAMVAVFTLHGAAFTAMRMPREQRGGAVRAARRCGPLAAGLLLAGGVAVPVFGIDLLRPVPAALILVVAVTAAVAGPRLLEHGRDGRAFAVTAVAAAAPLLAVGSAMAPLLTHGTAGPDTLALLARVTLPVVPLLLAAQAWLWWTFRHRVGRGTAVFF